MKTERQTDRSRDDIYRVI